MAVIPLTLLLVTLGSDPAPIAVDDKSNVLPCELSAARVEFDPDVVSPPPVACVTPETATVILFHAPIDPGSVMLQGDAFFKIAATPDSILVVPKGTIPIGQTFQVAVRFPDGAAPSSAAIRLLAHAAVATRQINVYRRARTVEAYRQEALQAREEVDTIRALLHEKEIACKYEGGLSGLILSGLLGKLGLGARAFDSAPKGLGQKVALKLYRLPEKRLAISATFEDPAYTGVEVAGAFLTDNLGTDLAPLHFWTSGKSEREAPAQVVAEWAVDQRKERRTFTLILTINGGQTLHFENIRFP